MNFITSWVKKHVKLSVVLAILIVGSGYYWYKGRSTANTIPSYVMGEVTLVRLVVL